MNNSETLDKLKEMRLYGMYDSYKTHLNSGKTEQYTPDQFLAELVEDEYEDRLNRKINRLIDTAKFRYKGSIENINYHRERNLNRTQITRLAECAFIAKRESILITGPTGIGKSYIACALGYQACAKEYKVLYFSAPKLFARLKQAKADNSYQKEMAKIEKTNLLIIDDFGLHPLDAHSRAILMEIIEDIHGNTSIIFTSQLPVKEWHSIIGEKTIADAVLDRLVHNAHRIEADGESMRKIRPKKDDENIYE